MVSLFTNEEQEKVVNDIEQPCVIHAGFITFYDVTDKECETQNNSSFGISPLSKTASILYTCCRTKR